MGYTYSKEIESNFNEAIEKVTAALKTEGFGVLTEIDMQATMKAKLDVDIPKYKILGACNPGFAYKALQAENEIGSMLPCNVVVQETASGNIKISAVNPVASMMAIKNEELNDLAGEVGQKLERMISGL